VTENRQDKYLISADSLAQRLDDPALRIFDATAVGSYNGDTGEYDFRSGRAMWEQGHIPGSEHVDIHELSDPESPYGYTLPSPDAFSERMSALGVGPGTEVVVYEFIPTMWATRLWWLLRVFGFDAVRILDGGFKFWSEGGYPVSTEPAPERPPARFEAQFRPELVADTAEVEKQVATGEAKLVNALTEDMHRGIGSIAYSRRGRIPGSVCAPSISMVDPESFCFLPPEELRERFAEAGLLDEGRPVITYCGAGMAATQTTFALALAGREDVPLYDGSMQEWTDDPKRPVETG
jgi:thiosulfate/3-mercaptopyruvate sulfurtransferase